MKHPNTDLHRAGCVACQYSYDSKLPDADKLSGRLCVELDEAEKKAIDSLSRYKFQMFGYWAAIWVHLNRISGAKRPNPFRSLVRMAAIERVGQ